LNSLLGDPFNYPYPSRRAVVQSLRGMVATSHPLAAQAGLKILQAGGNAIDAAVATAAALTVVEPTSNCIGGDTLALVWHENQLHGLNASGPAPKNISIAKLAAQGFSAFPTYGPSGVTVPGTPASWVALSERFGNLSLQQSMHEAIELAREGFPVSPTVAYAWNQAFQLFKDEFSAQHFKPWFEAFAPLGRAPRSGEIWKQPDQANTLSCIASDHGESFYHGSLARDIASFCKNAGGYLSVSDLAGFKPDWVEPISANYRGYTVWEMPPNCQGIVALMALGALKDFSFSERDSALTYHRQIEAIKLAFELGIANITDIKRMSISVNEMLSETTRARMHSEIKERARLPANGQQQRGGTVYVSCADAQGNMVSLIQSGYMNFGSGLVVPGTGINLQNRGNGFSLDPSHPNCLEGGKRPFHTIIPGFLTHGNRPVGAFGVIGSYLQPQAHVQMVMNMIDFGLNPQAALDAPRWEWTKGNQVSLERGTPQAIFDSLQSLGHEVSWSTNPLAFGRGQIILRDTNGVLTGGTEPRSDSSIAAW